MKDLHHNIKRLRKIKGYTQQKIADLVGISRMAYSNIELGKSIPDESAKYKTTRPKNCPLPISVNIHCIPHSYSGYDERGSKTK